MKAIKVIFKENAEIVIASSSNFLDFCAAVCETFNLPVIEEVKWNSCKVNANSFAALLNEQNLEFTIQAPQLFDISNSQKCSFLSELNKADTTQSSPLCQFSSIINDYVDFVVPLKKINQNFENQCTAKECHVNVVQPLASQLSSSVLQYMDEECHVNVVQPPLRQLSSSPNTPNTPRKISSDSDEVARLRTFLTTSTLNFLNNVLTNDILKKELKNRIFQYCQVVLPSDNDPWVRREFFSKLKSTLLFNFPNCLENWDSLLRQVSNIIRQQRWTKSHMTSNGTAIKQFQQVTKPKKSPYIMDSISKAEPVLSEEQLLLEVENELLKSKPSINVLAILNRNIFHPKIYEKLPIRLSLAPCLIIAEFKRLCPQYSFIEESCTIFVTKAFAGSSNHLESLLDLQCKLGSKKAKDLLFKKSESEDLLNELKIPAKYGPQVIFNSAQYGVRSRSGFEMISTD